MRVAALLCLFGFSVAAQGTPARDDAKGLLLEVRKKVLQTVVRLPRYMCTETVDRSMFEPEQEVRGRSCDDLTVLRRTNNWKTREHTSDRLRLEVAVTSESEMYSWVGEDRFQDRSLAEMVQGGATSTGAFASLLVSIFGTNDADFSYEGDVEDHGRTLAEFGYRVPLEKSKYRIGNKSQHFFVAYGGTFLADPKANDLVRLTVHADELPPELNTCESTTTLDYGSMQLNGSEFLIPKDAHWRVSNPDGSEFDNRTVFSACHEFLGKSTLRFDAAFETAGTAARKPVPQALELPSGLPFAIVLLDAIDTARAAAGDLFRARLTKPIKGNHGEILIPSGAAIAGRIVRIERHYEPASQFLTLALKMETIEVNGAPQPFAARLQSVSKRRQRNVDALVTREELGSFDRMLDPENPGAGFLRFDDVTQDYVIQRGLMIAGRTAGTDVR